MPIAKNLNNLAFVINILAFETSCDDTAVAIVNQDGRVLSNFIYSQVVEHAPYGGVVPEIGSRCHSEKILPLTSMSLAKAGLVPKDINMVAATFGPGLVGPLLVGAQFAKGFALAQNIPLVPVHHIEGHIFSGYLEEDFPSQGNFLALIVSGGHTSIYLCDEGLGLKTLGQTIDDAAGEAFDKIGRYLGLGYPAGKMIDELSMGGDKDRFSLPVGLKNSKNYDFSFSGLKTAAIRLIDQHKEEENFLPDFCASLQKAIAESLIDKTIKAAKDFNIKNIVLGGGVSANSYIRDEYKKICKINGLNIFLPSKNLCTDNAVMIARAALAKNGRSADLSIDVRASLPIERRDELYDFTTYPPL